MIVFKWSVIFFSVMNDIVCAGGTYIPGFAPAIITMRRAMRLCRFHFSIEAARQMTPIRRSVVSLKYSDATWKHKHTDSCIREIKSNLVYLAVRIFFPNKLYEIIIEDYKYCIIKFIAVIETENLHLLSWHLHLINHDDVVYILKKKTFCVIIVLKTKARAMHC